MLRKNRGCVVTSSSPDLYPILFESKSCIVSAHCLTNSVTHSLGSKRKDKVTKMET